MCKSHKIIFDEIRNHIQKKKHHNLFKGILKDYLLWKNSEKHQTYCFQHPHHVRYLYPSVFCMKNPCLLHLKLYFSKSDLTSCFSIMITCNFMQSSTLNMSRYKIVLMSFTTNKPQNIPIKVQIVTTAFNVYLRTSPITNVWLFNKNVKFTSVLRLYLYCNLAMYYSNSKLTECCLIIQIGLFKTISHLYLLHGFV